MKKLVAIFLFVAMCAMSMTSVFASVDYMKHPGLPKIPRAYSNEPNVINNQIKNTLTGWGVHYVGDKFFSVTRRYKADSIPHVEIIGSVYYTGRLSLVKSSGDGYHIYEGYLQGYLKDDILNLKPEY